MQNMHPEGTFPFVFLLSMEAKETAELLILQIQSMCIGTHADTRQNDENAQAHTNR